MKLTIFTLLFLFGTSFSTYASEQAYISIVSEDYLWSYYVTGSDEYRPSYFYNAKYKFKGDTIINNKTYKKFGETGCRYDDIGYEAAMREEDGKVYCANNSNYFKSLLKCMRSTYKVDEMLDEFLIYDFNLNVGDTFIDEKYGGSYEVRKVEYITINGKLRKCIYLDADIWIEGIGSIEFFLHNPLQPITTCGGSFSQTLTYQKDKDIITYRTEGDLFNPYECDEYIPLVKENAVWSYCDVWKKEQDKYDITYWQYHFKGDTLINNAWYKKLYRTECGKKSEYHSAMREANRKVYSIEKGNTKEYLIYNFNLIESDEFVDEKNGHEIPLQSISYIEIDGKLRKKFNFSGGFYIEGIGSPSNFTNPFGPVATYDLGVFLNYYKQYDKIVYKTDEFYYKEDECNDYIPLISKDMYWSYYHYEYVFMSPGFVDYYSSIKLKDDTVINDIKYSKLYHTYCNLKESSYAGAIREANKKVYCIFPNWNEEVLIYDFSLEEGDIFTNWEGENFKVTQTDYVVINGKTHKRIQFNYPEVENQTPEPYETWIEGIGSISQLVYRPLPPPIVDGVEDHINYVKKGDDFLHRTYESFYTEDECRITSLKNVNIERHFFVHENPVKSGELLISFTANTYNQIVLINTQGEVVEKKNITEQTQMKIETKKYPSGIYFIRLTSNGDTVSEKIIIP